jgi:hypothetical protein
MPALYLVLPMGFVPPFLPSMPLSNSVAFAAPAPSQVIDGAIEAFIHDKDLDELADTIRLAARHHRRDNVPPKADAPVSTLCCVPSAVVKASCFLSANSLVFSTTLAPSAGSLLGARPVHAGGEHGAGWTDQRARGLRAEGAVRGGGPTCHGSPRGVLGLFLPLLACWGVSLSGFLL